MFPRSRTGSSPPRSQMPNESLYRAPWIRDRDFKAAPRIEMEIPLKRMVHVRGVDPGKGDGQADRGRRRQFQLSGTDRSLQFVHHRRQWPLRGPGLPGIHDPICHLSEPKAYLKRGHGIKTVIGDKDGQTIPPVELERGVTLRGIVVDAEDKPVVAAIVEGKWDRTYPVNSPDHPGMALGQTFRRRPRRTPRVNSSSKASIRAQRDARGKRGRCPHRPADPGRGGNDDPGKARHQRCQHRGAGRASRRRRR